MLESFKYSEGARIGGLEIFRIGISWVGIGDYLEGCWLYRCEVCSVPFRYRLYSEGLGVYLGTRNRS